MASRDGCKYMPPYVGTVLTACCSCCRCCCCPDGGACYYKQQAMTSSVLDGVGDMQSPAPPAFSPLTDPAPDSGNREPSVHDNTMLDQPEDPDNNITATLPQVPNGAAFQSATTLGQASSSSLIMNPDLDVDVDVAMHDAPPLLSPMDANALMTNSDTMLLMTLARMSAAAHQPILQPPSTVRPSQVTMRAALDSMMGTPDPLLAAPALPPVQAPANTPLESFAKIEFADCCFEMTTYAVIIGRDQQAMKQALKDERRIKEYERRIEESFTLGLPLPSPPIRDFNKFSKSYVSEEGGMLGPESDGASDRPVKRRRTGGPASASGDVQEPQKPGAAVAEQVEPGDKNNTLNRQYVSTHTPGAVPLNMGALRGNPDFVPFIGIHSPGPNIAANTKGISREHMKIEYDKKAGVFKAIPLHKNGFFIEDVHHKGHPVVLKSGTHIQIKDVEFTFYINGVPFGRTGIEEKPEEEAPKNRRYSEGGKEMSFEFEDTRDVDRGSTSPDEVQPQEANKEDSDSELSELEDEIAEPMDEGEEHDVVETIEEDPDREQQPFIKPEDMTPEMLAGLDPIPKRRGPGRPPKNGIMSKREERLRKKAAMELAKKNQPPAPPGEPVVKRKVGRPRKHPLPDDTPDRPEKRKYKPRKLKNGEEGGEVSDPEKTTKERRREKPKTPPLALERSDYTEEQLQKPSKNYGILIDEVLSAAPDGLSLKQIYKRIQMKYPYYYFLVDTKGWESSVRHNLIGNDAFRKDDETHLWHRIPGIDIDQGKKRKAVSPDHSTSLHTFGQHYQTPAAPPGQMFHAEAGTQQGYRPGAVPQRPGYPAVHGQVNLGQHPHQHLSAQPVAAGAQQQQPQRPAYPTTSQPQGQEQIPGYGEQPAAARQLPLNAQTPGYSSPYASRPPPAAAAATQHAGVAQNSARPGPPPHAGPSPYNGLPRVNSATPLQGAPATARPGQQPALTNGVSVPLKPVVSKELAEYIEHFKQTTTVTLLDKALQGRMPEVQMVVMSVIARGLGLSTESIIPEYESIESIVLRVFQNTCDTKFKETGTLHPDLVKDLVSFRTRMMDILMQKLGSRLNADRLVLSATTRELGFADKSWMPNSERYAPSEAVLMENIKKSVLAHQEKVAGLSLTGTPTPGTPAVTTPSTPRAPMTAAAPAYSAAPPSHHANMARPPLAPQQPAHTGTASRPMPSGQTSAQQASQPISRLAWTPAPVAGQHPIQTPSLRTGAGAPAQMQHGTPVTGAAASPARSVAPITPHPQSQTSQQAAPVRTMAPAAPTMYSPTPHALAQSLVARSQAAAAAAAQGMQPVQTPRAQQAPPVQPRPAQVSFPQVTQASPAPLRPVQASPAQTPSHIAASARPAPPPQTTVQSVAQTAPRQGPAHIGTSPAPPQAGAQSATSTAARTGPALTAPTQVASARTVNSTAPPRAAAQSATHTPARSSLTTTQPMAQPNPQSAAPARPSPAPPSQQVSQIGVQQSLGSATPVQPRVQSPAPAISRLSGPAGLPPKPIVPAPGLAPISPSVSQNPTPATASPVPSAARPPSAQGQQYKPAAPYTNPTTVAQAPPSAQGQGQPYAQVPPRAPVQSSNHMAPQAQSPAAMAQSQGQKSTQPSVPSVSTRTPQQTAARPVNTATQGQGQMQGQQNNNISQNSTTSAPAPKPSMAPTAPVASMTAGSPPAHHASTNSAQNPTAAAPAPTPTATAAR
ncbi:hypothetical protein QBC44DRAFT_359874 [Cladorrhinum sp. PSN332]|nr:hypothetical protein QBC44DRAFT_359874 [Cladorrhinum sp. PSN332]